MKIKCVLFDLGGVVFSSPIGRLAKLEKRFGITHNALNRYIMNSKSWKDLERGLIGPEQFVRYRYDDELKGTTEGVESNIRKVTGADVMGAIASPDANVPRDAMKEALRTLRKHGIKTVALTNNFKSSDTDGNAISGMVVASQPLFDDVLESSKIGMRKPSVGIYEYACSASKCSPDEMVFLDDIGANLKPAKAIGMRTIRVMVDDEQGVQALLKLEKVVGIQPLFQSFRPPATMDAKL